MTSTWWKCNKVFTALVLALVLLSACERPPEWRQLDEGTSWKLLAFGEGKPSADSIGLIRLDARITDDAGAIELGHMVAQPFSEPGDALWQFLTTRVPGDSLEFRFSGPNFLYPDQLQGDTLRANVGIRSFKTTAELRDARQREYTQLDTLLRHPRIAAHFEEYRGVWMRTVRSTGDTTSVERGREVVVHYKGAFMDGRTFDDSRRMDGPFYFVYGNEGQVIKGLELALERMHKGDVVDVILPSWLAYGKKGSADGRVPPYTTVRYTIELIEIGL